MKKNQKGSALLWALIVVGVLSILIAASLTIAFAYKHRAVVNNDKRQAYLTAKGFIEDIVDNVISTGAKDTNNEYLALFDNTESNDFDPLVKVGGEIPLIIDVPKENNMGTIANSYIRINELTEELKTDEVKGFITISVQATYANQAYRVNADLMLAYRKDIGGLKWELIRYYQIDEGITHNNNVTVGKEILSQLKLLYDTYLEKGFNAVREILVNDPGWNNLPKDVQDKINTMGYFDDDTIRKFMYYSDKDKQDIEFNKDEIMKTQLKVPVATAVNTITVKDVDLKGTLSSSDFKITDFNSETFYIKPKYSSNMKEIQFAFANTKKMMNSDGVSINNGGEINLFYFNGSWYFIGKVSFSATQTPIFISPTSFDSKSLEEWEYFKTNFLTEGNRIQW